mmetsp:Transcript_12348/g.49743  ORF Transcript_12348/g.49743 Transcript_12348/m.49743 type:complete len:451 (+) Transcript_12348:1219-2571(+)
MESRESLLLRGSRVERSPTHDAHSPKNCVLTPDKRTLLVGVHADGLLEGAVDDFAQRGVGVDREGEVADRGARLLGVGDLGDKVGRVEADDVRAEDLLGLFVEQQLDDAVALALGERFRVGAEVGHGLAELEALVGGARLGFVFVEADRGDLGVREARSGNRLVVHDVLAAADVLDGRNALGRCSVREHLDAVRVADAVEMRDDLAVLFGGQNAHAFVDGDDASRERDAVLFEIQRLCIRDATRRDEARINLQRLDGLLGLGVDRLDDDGALVSHAGRHLGREDARSVIDTARLQEQPVGDARNFPVEGRHERVEGLDEGHFGAQRGVHISKLEADDARADDRDVLRHVLQVERLVRRIHRGSVDLDAWRHERHRPRRQDDVLSRVSVALLGNQRVLAAVRRELRDDLDAEPVERALEPAADFGHELLRVRRNTFPIVRRAARERDAHRG